MGFATRLTAIAGLVIIILNYSVAGLPGYYMYWAMVMAVLFVSGPGAFSLDELVFNFLKQRYPQLSGKPAFNLENLTHVVIIGAGFGGIACAKALRHVPVKVTLIDRHNYHLFQPLLYQIATGSLSPGDIAISIRSIFLKQFNVDVMLGNVSAIDKEKRLIKVGDLQISYDYLVIATGASHSYFGKDEWEPYAPGLKTIKDATAVRSRILETFEMAELAQTNEERQLLLNFVIVGAGPTGVELAGAIAELARFGMEKDFRHFDPASANIILIQGAPRILPTFSEKISAAAQSSLESMGIKVLTNSVVEQIDSEGVIVNGQRIYSKSVLWAAGVIASPAAKWLEVEADPAGRVKVIDDLSVPNYPEIFVIGDTAASNAWKGNLVPGLAPAAKQGGSYVAKIISDRVYRKATSKPFKYIHLGSLATIGRKFAVAEFNTIKINGEVAWWFWGGVHVSFLLGARNRLSVIVNWIWSYFTFRANNLLITEISSQEENVRSNKEVR
ncbi:NAD(P)/FAD-dependent oxidoreductase [Legionella tunisiensis]|uniref:NAD(P)/FAD-dependent oxidoreductase n=1 Tax=Legionella tunisiensis TaxID=1034944 RepID=UPI0002D5A306|nr:NAD(P)/FAD-dependent oxidoreductase [Legionella tunisiensis]